jgi:predicted ATPase
VREHIRNHRIFRLSPAALGAPSAPARSDVIPSLGKDGAGLPTLLSVLAGAERRRLDAIEDQLVAAVPTLAGFQILPTPEGHHRLAFTLKGSQTRIEASQMSDGVLLLLGYLSLLHHPRPPAVLLLEEPELGMHPRWLADIVRLLRTLTTAAPAEAAPARPATQVIVTTHAPALLDQVRPGEAFFLHRGADGAATATRFDAIHDIEERLQGSSLGALWTALGEDRLHELAHQPQPGRARAERAQTEPGMASHAGVPA